MTRARATSTAALARISWWVYFPRGLAHRATSRAKPAFHFRHTAQDGIDDLDQYTQEIRFAQQATDAVFWQAGVYYFDSKFTVTTYPFFVPPTTVEHKNTAWAVFAHVSVDVTDAWNLTGGVRYTDDDKDFRVISNPVRPRCAASPSPTASSAGI